MKCISCGLPLIRVVAGNLVDWVHLPKKCNAEVVSAVAS